MTFPKLSTQKKPYLSHAGASFSLVIKVKNTSEKLALAERKIANSYL